MSERVRVYVGVGGFPLPFDLALVGRYICGWVVIVVIVVVDLYVVPVSRIHIWALLVPSDTPGVPKTMPPSAEAKPNQTNVCPPKTNTAPILS